jgi:hypothetical protein
MYLQDIPGHYTPKESQIIAIKEVSDGSPSDTPGASHEDYIQRSKEYKRKCQGHIDLSTGLGKRYCTKRNQTNHCKSKIKKVDSEREKQLLSTWKQQHCTSK